MYHHRQGGLRLISVEFVGHVTGSEQPWINTVKTLCEENPPVVMLLLVWGWL